MQELSLCFYGQDQGCYFLMYSIFKNKWTLINEKGESMNVDENEMFLALESMFKLRGNHEFIK